MTALIQTDNNTALCIQPICKSADTASWYELSFGNNNSSDSENDDCDCSSFAEHSALPLDLQLDLENETVILSTSTTLSNSISNNDLDDSSGLSSSWNNSFASSSNNSCCGASSVRSNVPRAPKRSNSFSLSRGPSFRLGNKQNSLRLLHNGDIDKGDCLNDSASICSVGSGVPSAPPLQVSVTTTPPASRLQMFKKHLGGKYTGLKERARRANESNERRGLVKSALYTCMEDDDDEEDILGSMMTSSTSSSSSSSAPSAKANRRSSKSSRPRPLPNVAVSRSA